jgi:hypothetical protein
MPDPSKRQAKIADPSQYETVVERSAQEVHEAYMAKIHEMREIRAKKAEEKRLLEEKEAMLLIF